MKLYNVYYAGRSMDTNIRLPKQPTSDTRYAECANGAKEYLVPSGNQWVRVSKSVIV